MLRPDSFESRWPIYAWTIGFPLAGTTPTGLAPVGFAGQSAAQVQNVPGFPVDVPQPGIVRYVYAWAFDTFAANLDNVNNNPLDAIYATFKMDNVSATGNKLLPLKSVAGDGIRPRHVYFPITTSNKLLVDFQNVRDPATIDQLNASITFAICPLPFTCGECKTKNEPDAKFCKNCGTGLPKR